MEAGILGSQEYLQRAGGTANAFLAGLYRDVLHRNVDPSGTATFAPLLSLGLSRGKVAGLVLSSPEAETDLLQSFYEQVLYRSADDFGLNAYLAALQHQVRDESVLAMIFDSKEFLATL